MQLGQHNAKFPPNLGAKPPYSHFEAKKMWCFFFFWCFSLGAEPLDLHARQHRGCLSAHPIAAAARWCRCHLRR